MARIAALVGVGWCDDLAAVRSHWQGSSGFSGSSDGSGHLSPAVIHEREPLGHQDQSMEIHRMDIKIRRGKMNPPAIRVMALRMSLFSSPSRGLPGFCGRSQPWWKEAPAGHDEGSGASNGVDV